jgi:hypothetical protein
VQLRSFNGRDGHGVVRVVEFAEDLRGHKGGTATANFEHLPRRWRWLQFVQLRIRLGGAWQLAILIVEHEVPWESDGQVGTFVHVGGEEKVSGGEQVYVCGLMSG